MGLDRLSAFHQLGTAKSLPWQRGKGGTSAAFFLKVSTSLQGAEHMGTQDWRPWMPIFASICSVFSLPNAFSLWISLLIFVSASFLFIFSGCQQDTHVSSFKKKEVIFKAPKCSLQQDRTWLGNFFFLFLKTPFCCTNLADFIQHDGAHDFFLIFIPWNIWGCDRIARHLHM